MYSLFILSHWIFQLINEWKEVKKQQQTNKQKNSAFGVQPVWVHHMEQSRGQSWTTDLPQSWSTDLPQSWSTDLPQPIKKALLARLMRRCHIQKPATIALTLRTHSSHGRRKCGRLSRQCSCFVAEGKTCYLPRCWSSLFTWAVLESHCPV